MSAIGFSTCLFFLALIIYAFFSSPTPDSPAMPEFIIGLCLILSVPALSLSYIFIRRSSGFYSVLGSNANRLFWLRSAQSERAQNALLWFLIIIGLVFALRVLLPIFAGDPATHLSFAFQAQDPFYLVNAPTVLFTAVFLAGTAGYKIWQRCTTKRLLISMIIMCVAIIPMVAMASIMQRASIGYIFVSLLFLVTIAFARRPLRALPLVMIGVFFVYAFSDMIGVVTEQLIQKTELVGLNMRLQEASAVINHVEALGVAHIVFGGGWGESFISPAVGELRVNFTHNLFTTMFLKMGLIGLVGSIVYLFPLCFMLINILRRNPVMACALAGPFFINVFLYASFKSFDFGLILLMIVLWGTRDCLRPSLEGGALRRV